jgi:type I restriction enzyme S subunit
MAIFPREEHLDLSYIVHWFERFDLNTLTSGSTVPQLNKRDLAPLLVAVPPINEQREFARRAAAVARVKAAQRASLLELDALFASLQNRAFRGDL